MTKPFLKWAGGKRWLAPTIVALKPHGMARYIEPFLGGGAVFFALRPASAILSDVNPELIELYLAVRDFPTKIRELLEWHQKMHSPAHYYRMRASAPTSEIEGAARTLYLNRTCWNGLYRVNRKGEFNVPIGTKSKVLDPGECFDTIAQDLNAAKIIRADFELTINEAGKGDFLFVDPPYTVKHNENGFLKYNETIFSWDDQVRLHTVLGKAVGRGATVLVTNADHETVRGLYSDFSYQTLHRSSVLAGKSDKRGSTTEALFFANLEPEGLEVLSQAGGFSKAFHLGIDSTGQKDAENANSAFLQS